MDADYRFILASQHPDADSLYVRLCGCIPRLPMLLMSGKSETLVIDAATQIDDAVLNRRTLGAPAEQYAQAETLIAEPIVPTPQILDTFAELDRQAIGFSRSEEHVLWCAEMGGPGGRSRLFRRAEDGADGAAGEIVGYAYIGAHASGPALALSAADLPRMISHVTWIFHTFDVPQEWFGSAIPDRSWAISGTNAAMLHWMMSRGWHVSFYYLYMSTHAAGALDRYVCCNPLYLL